jgi:hypothetical protein
VPPCGISAARAAPPARSKAPSVLANEPPSPAHAAESKKLRFEEIAPKWVQNPEPTLSPDAPEVAAVAEAEAIRAEGQFRPLVVQKSTSSGHLHGLAGNGRDFYAAPMAELTGIDVVVLANTLLKEDRTWSLENPMIKPFMLDSQHRCPPREPFGSGGSGPPSICW